MKFVCVIPARYASSRLPGKPLALIGGKPMVQHVYERAAGAAKIDEVIVATDDRRILDAVQEFGGKAVMTDPALPSGTDRVYQAIKDQPDVDVVINLQGDEPFIEPQLLNQLCAVFEEQPEVRIATPIKRIKEAADLENPNLVRVTRDKNGFALYFTRSVIPYLRDEKERALWHERAPFYKHVGIYSYRKDCLAELTALEQSSLEQIEKLEQLRFLENGYRIYTLITDYESLSVDTADDLEKVNRFIKSR